MTKTCSECGQSKPLVEFYSGTGSRKCRSCKRANCRAWYAENREHKNAMSRQWHKDNHVSMKASKRS